MKNKIIIILLITLQTVFAQKKDENIGTEVVNVVKPYSPTVSDANKIKEVPTLDDAMHYRLVIGVVAAPTFGNFMKNLAQNQQLEMKKSI